MRLIELSSASVFLSRCQRFLMEDEARNNLLLSSAMTLARASVPRLPRLSFFVVESGASVLAAALHADGRRLLLSTSTPEGASFLARELTDRMLPIRGVFGPVESAEPFLELGRGQPARTQNLMSVSRVCERPTAPGRFREATEEDLPILFNWSRQMADEIRLDESQRETEEVTRALVRNKQTYLWDNGTPVAMASFNGPTPSGVRLSMVYTDPERRSRGFARSLVQMLSAQLLADGHQTCFLFVDAANPVAVHVYSQLGYRTVSAFTELGLLPDRESQSRDNGRMEVAVSHSGSVG